MLSGSRNEVGWKFELMVTGDSLRSTIPGSCASKAGFERFGNFRGIDTGRSVSTRSLYWIGTWSLAPHPHRECQYELLNAQQAQAKSWKYRERRLVLTHRRTQPQLVSRARSQ